MWSEIFSTTKGAEIMSHVQWSKSEGCSSHMGIYSDVLIESFES